MRVFLGLLCIASFRDCHAISVSSDDPTNSLALSGVQRALRSLQRSSINISIVVVHHYVYFILLYFF